jgi:hypothetical protein
VGGHAEEATALCALQRKGEAIPWSLFFMTHAAGQPTLAGIPGCVKMR